MRCGSSTRTTARRATFYRAGLPSEIGAVIAFLASKRAMYFATATSPTECRDLLGREFRAPHRRGTIGVRWVGPNLVDTVPTAGVERIGLL